MLVARKLQEKSAINVKLGVMLLRTIYEWSGRGDSNPRPSPWQGDALPLSPFRSYNTNYTENQQLIPRVSIKFPVTRVYRPLNQR